MPAYVQPYMGERPEGLSQEEAQRWFFESQGVPVPGDRDRELVDAAVKPGN